MNGIINLKKEGGMTSFGAVARVRKALQEKKVGHGGTLDPEATGVLPVLVGTGTKCSDLFLEFDKTYRAIAKFGITTDTQDVWGEILESRENTAENLTENQLREAMQAFKGDILQIPPMYSALKRDGVPLYKLARKGESIEVEPRPVTVYDIGLLDFYKNEQGVFAELNIQCSRGTYIRTIIHDLGEALGCGAAMASLERTAYGPLKIEDAVTVSEVDESKLLPLDILFGNMKKIALSDKEATDYMQGKAVCADGKISSDIKDNEKICLLKNNNVFAIAGIKREEGKIILTHDKFFGF